VIKKHPQEIERFIALQEWILWVSYTAKKINKQCRRSDEQKKYIKKENKSLLEAVWIFHRQTRSSSKISRLIQVNFMFSREFNTNVSTYFNTPRHLISQNETKCVVFITIHYFSPLPAFCFFLTTLFFLQLVSISRLIYWFKMLIGDLFYCHFYRFVKNLLRANERCKARFFAALQSPWACNYRIFVFLAFLLGWLFQFVSIFFSC
jgi:hypothetical protein